MLMAVLLAGPTLVLTSSGTSVLKPSYPSHAVVLCESCPDLLVTHCPVCLTGNKSNFLVTHIFDSVILYLEDDGFRPWPNLPSGPR